MTTKMTEKQKAMRRRAKPKHPGGRPPLDPGGETMRGHKVRTTDAQWDRFHEKGGAAGFRAWLESDD